MYSINEVFGVSETRSYYVTGSHFRLRKSREASDVTFFRNGLIIGQMLSMVQGERINITGGFTRVDVKAGTTGGQINFNYGEGDSVSPYAEPATVITGAQIAVGLAEVTALITNQRRASVTFKAPSTNTGTVAIGITGITIAMATEGLSGFLLAAGQTKQIDIGAAAAFYCIASLAGQLLNITEYRLG